MKVIN